MSQTYLDGRPLHALYVALYGDEPSPRNELRDKSYRRQQVYRWAAGVDNGTLVFVNQDEVRFELAERTYIEAAALTDSSGTIVHSLPLTQGGHVYAEAPPTFAAGSLIVYALGSEG